MSRIADTLQIAATPASVFAAISQENGLKRWWTSDATMEPTLGSVAELGFYNRAIVIRLRVEELQPARRIRWHCVGGPPEYLGSEIVFDLAPVADGTLVHFEHGGLQASADFLDHAAQSWRHVLSSLKSYIETGVGVPISM